MASDLSGVSSFRSEHLDYVRDLKPQHIGEIDDDTHYLVPSNNFNELVRKLNVLSCGVRVADGRRSAHPSFPRDGTLAEYCIGCPTESVMTANSGRRKYEGDNVATFKAFPRDLYRTTAVVGISPEKAKDFAHSYLDGFHSTMIRKVDEDLTRPEISHWGKHALWGRVEESQLGEDLREMLRFLEDLETVAKKSGPPKPQSDHLPLRVHKEEDNPFLACSDHLTDEFLSNQATRLRHETAQMFQQKYRVDLQPSDVSVGFEKKKIFTVA